MFLLVSWGLGLWVFWLIGVLLVSWFLGFLLFWLPGFPVSCFHVVAPHGRVDELAQAELEEVPSAACSTM